MSDSKAETMKLRALVDAQARQIGELSYLLEEMFDRFHALEAAVKAASRSSNTPEGAARIVPQVAVVTKLASKKRHDPA